MGVLYTNTFTGTSGPPADFTLSESIGAGGTIDLVANQLRTLTTATNFNDQRLILPSALWNKSDGEARITVFTQASGIGQLNLILRGSGNWDPGENDSPITGYKAFINFSGDTIEFYKRVGGVTTQIGTAQPFTFATSTTYGVAFKVVGFTLSVKVWTGTEPGSYTYSVADPGSSIAGPGQFQMNFRTVSSAVRDLRYDNFTLDDLVTVVGTVAKTLAPVRTASAVLDESGLPVLDESGLPLLSDGAAGTFGTTGGTVARTLANVTSATAGIVAVTGTLARPLANATVAASGGSSTSGTVARTLQNVVVQAAGGQGVTGTLVKTLANATVVAAGAFGGGAGVTGTVARTLDAVETASPLTDEFGDPINDGTGLPLLDESGNPVTDESGNPLLDTSGGFIFVPGAEGSVGLGSGNLAVTLANVVAVASGVTGGGTGTVARTLGNVTSVASGTHGVPGSLAVTLGDTTSTASGVVGATGSVARTLDNTTSAASGTNDPGQVAGNLGVTLAAVVAAAGGSSTAGEIIETLDALTVAASGTAGPEPVTGIVAVVLANLTAQAFGLPGVTGTANRTLADLLANGQGSSVAGTVNETLDDVTSTTGGTGSYTDFQSVTIRERGHMITIREMSAN